MELEDILQCHKSQPSLPILDEINAVHVLLPTYWRSVLILPFQIFLWVSSGHFLSGFSTKTLYAFHLSVSYVPHILPLPVFLICHWHDICWELQSTKVPMTRVIQFPPSFFLLNRSIPLSDLFLDALCLCSSPIVTNQVYMG